MGPPPKTRTSTSREAAAALALVARATLRHRSIDPAAPPRRRAIASREAAAALALVARATLRRSIDPAAPPRLRAIAILDAVTDAVIVAIVMPPTKPSTQVLALPLRAPVTLTHQRPRPKNGPVPPSPRWKVRRDLPKSARMNHSPLRKTLANALQCRPWASEARPSVSWQTETRDKSRDKLHTGSCAHAHCHHAAR